MASTGLENDPLAQKIDALGSNPRPLGLPPVLAPGVKLDPKSICHPGLETLYIGFFGTRNYHRAVVRRLAHKLEIGSAIVNRPLTQDELDFYVETISQATSNNRWGLITGVEFGMLTGLVLGQRKKEFQQYAPPLDANRPAIFTRYVETLKAMRVADPAVFQRTIMSLCKTTFIGGLCGWFVGSAYAMSRSAAAASTDPRIKQHREEFMKVDQRVAERRRRAAMVARVQGAQGKLEDDLYNQEGLYQGGFEESSSTTTSQPADTSASPTIQSQTYPLNTPTESQSTPAWPTPHPETYSSSVPTSGQSKDGTFFDDDASPIAPDYRDTNTAPQGSAWERIRQQNQNPSYNPSVTQPQYQRAPLAAEATGNDSYRERERAQAEFDRMLEAERNQHSDSDGGSRGASGWWK
ncbi:putative endo-1,3(4)-beta-glucanase [Aspergillus foveolatus]|uniref:putative endo-1,3(4)-beta-glucanase n=1 Tax=Aspergillus foveolatus TaxID=210207 RepID=UPI003CCD350C